MGIYPKKKEGKKKERKKRRKEGRRKKGDRKEERRTGRKKGGKKNTNSKRYLCPSVHSSIVYNSQDVESKHPKCSSVIE